MNPTIDVSFLLAELMLGTLCLILAVTAIDLEKRRRRLFIGTIVLMLATAFLRLLLDGPQFPDSLGSARGMVQFLWEVLTLLTEPVLTLHLLDCCEESPGAVRRCTRSAPSGRLSLFWGSLTM